MNIVGGKNGAQKLNRCPHHGLAKVVEACRSCLDLMKIERDQLKRLHAQDPEFIQALRQRNYELNKGFEYIEKEIGRYTFDATSVEGQLLNEIKKLCKYIRANRVKLPTKAQDS